MHGTQYFMILCYMLYLQRYGARPKKKSENTSYLTEQGLGLYNAFHKKLEID